MCFSWTLLKVEVTQPTLLTISTMYVVFSVFHGRLRVCKFVRKVTKFLLRDSIIEPGEAQKNQHAESRVYIVDKKKWFVSEYQYVRASDMKGNTKWQYLEDNWITLMLATPHQIVPTLKVARRKDLKGSNSTSGDGGRVFSEGSLQLEATSSILYPIPMFNWTLHP